MIPTSPLLREAARYSQTLSLTVDILYKNSVVLPDVPTIDGGLSCDRGQKVRMSSDVTVDLTDFPGFEISQYIHRFRVKRGYQSLGVKESISHGEFRVDDVSYNSNGSQTLAGSGLEAYIVDARFIRPRTPPYGQSTIAQIKYLIQEVLPGWKVVVEATQDKPIRATAPWARERWDAIDALADSINAEVFADYRGVFVIRNVPNVSRNKPVYKLDEGDDGVLIDRKYKRTRDRVYNAVSVSGQSSDPNKPPVNGWAYDNNPASPTYFYGPFGQVPRFYSSQFFRTAAQCTAYARTLLGDALAKNESLAVSALPLTFLEPGDVIEIVLASGQVERRILQKISFDLGTAGAVAIDTLLPKNLGPDES